tara:strand:+ start:3092 stop:3424 length:333 start_codon:yes stop_codon:yes gene_type:complete
MEPLLIITNFPDKTSAQAFAQKLVKARLAACVNILTECSSVYNWQGKTEVTNEIPVFIKTQAQHYAQVAQTIKTMHPYELPEVIAVPVSNGLPAYLQWIADETQIIPDKT